MAFPQCVLFEEKELSLSLSLFISSAVFSIRVVMSSCDAYLHDLIRLYLPKPPTPNTVTLEVKAATYEFLESQTYSL